MVNTRVFNLGTSTQKVQVKDNKWLISSSLNSDSELTYRLKMVKTTVEGGDSAEARTWLWFQHFQSF